MAAYRRVYDSHHLQADCQELVSAPNPALGIRGYGLPLPFLLTHSVHLSMFCTLHDDDDDDDDA